MIDYGRRKWSAREDSNLRPTGPKPVALPSCATRRMRAHLTATLLKRQYLFSKRISAAVKVSIPCIGSLKPTSLSVIHVTEQVSDTSYF